MGKILRISNLSDDTTVEDLRAFFSGIDGLERAKIMPQDEAGKPTGHGLVKMATSDAARSAISALNGRTLKGREIRVAAARKQPPLRKPGETKRPFKSS